MILKQVAHPGVVSVHEYGHCAVNGDYFTMEYIDWPTLDRLQVSLSGDQIVKILCDLSIILAFVHRHQILHLDLKPDNIFVDIETLISDPKTTRLTVKVADFGFARNQKKPENSEAYGSFTYIAPELLTGEQVDARADLYSIGMIGYTLLNSASPFSDNNEKTLGIQKQTFLPEMDDWPETTPEALRVILTRCIHPDPEFRPGTTAEVIGELTRMTQLPIASKYLIASSSFIGRSAELRHLAGLLFEVSTGVHWAYLLSGDSGIGKSRLMDEFALKQQVKQEVDIVRLERDDVKPLIKFLESRMQDISPRIEDYCESVLWRMLPECLNHHSNHKPLIVLWHRFDEASSEQVRGFKELLLNHTRLSVLWLLEVEREPDNLAGFTYADRFVRRRLRGFSDAETEELVGDLIGHANGYRLLSQRLKTTVGIKPGWYLLAIKELIRRGKICYEHGYWRILDPELKKWRVDLSGLLDIELNGLSNTAITVLEWLSVLDKQCSIEDLISLLEIEPKVWSKVVTEIAERGIADVVQGQLQFNQAIIQERVYQSIDPKQKMQLHRWSGYWLEERLTQESTLNAILDVARQFFLSGATGDFLRVMQRIIGMADRMSGEFPDPELLEAALNESDGFWDTAERSKAWELLAGIFSKQDRAEEARDIYRNLLSNPEFNKIPDSSVIQLRLGKCLFKSGELAESIQYLETAYQSLRVVNPDLAGDALGNMGYVFYLQGDFEKSGKCLNDYPKIIEQSIPPKRQPPHWLLCARLYLLHKRLDDAVGCYERIINQSKSSRSSSVVIRAQLYIARIMLMQGEYELVLKRLDMLERQHSLLLDRMQIWQLDYYRVLALLSTGQELAGSEEINRGVLRIKALAPPEEQCRLFIDIVCIDFYTGYYKYGIELLRQIIIIARRINFQFLLPILFSWLARYQWMVGKPSRGLMKQTNKLWFSCKQPTGKVMGGFLLSEHMLLTGQYKTAATYIPKTLALLDSSDVEIPKSALEIMHLVSITGAENTLSKRVDFSYFEGYLSDIKDPYLKGMYLYWLFWLAIKSNNDELSEEYYKRATTQFRSVHAHLMIAQCLELYSKALAGSGYRERSQDILKEVERIYQGLQLDGRIKSMQSQSQIEEDSPGSRKLSLLPIKDIAQIIEAMNTLDNPDKLTRKLLEVAMDGIGAKRGLIIFKREKTSGLSRRASVQIGSSEVEIISRSIADLVFKEGEPVFCENALRDNVLGSLDSVRIGNIRSVACLPIKSHNEIEGVLYIDFGSIARPISETEKIYLEMVSHLIGITLTQSHVIVHLKEDIKTLRRAADISDGYGEIKGRSNAIKEVFRLLSLIHGWDMPVLIIGESGTGKELVARTIHQESCRYSHPFFPLNCAAFPDQLVESLTFP